MFFCGFFFKLVVRNLLCISSARFLLTTHSNSVPRGDLCDRVKETNTKSKKSFLEFHLSAVAAICPQYSTKYSSTYTQFYLLSISVPEMTQLIHFHKTLKIAERSSFRIPF